MKKLFLAMAILAVATQAEARFWDNLKFWGSADNQKKNRSTYTQPVRPDIPVNVPEPASGILLATGILALIIGGAVERNIKK